MNLFGKTFKTALLFIIFIELLSFAGYYFPLVNKVAFFVILFITLILALEKLEYGLLILLAELFIGSKGYLFYFESGGVMVSLRIGLFLVIMGVWLYNKLKTQNPGLAPRSGAGSKIKISIQNLKLINLPIYYWLLFAAIAWGVGWGLVRGNSFNNVFFDANAWLYLFLIFPFFDVIKTKEQACGERSRTTANILQVFSASLIDIIVKSLFSLWIFSHQIVGFSFDLYRWLRTSGVGEVTPVAGNFYRVFFQSQIYTLLGFFILLCLWYWWLKQKGDSRAVILRPKAEESLAESRETGTNASNVSRIRERFLPRGPGVGMTLIIAFSLLTVIISFSRSFWIGLVGGLAALFLFLKFIAKESWLKLFKLAGVLLLILILNLGFLYLFVNFPKVGEGVSLASLIGERISASEAAGISRINQLKPLALAIAKHPIIGSGFGTTVTYYTRDPRILAENPSGEYTTYAFEWGYLDILLKVGLAGLLIYLGLIWEIFKMGIRNHELGIMNYLNLGLLLGLIALLLVNIFTPYLNHPLGIGYIMLVSVFLNKTDSEVLTKF
jgi:hypothetical protein